MTYDLFDISQYFERTFFHKPCDIRIHKKNFVLTLQGEEYKIKKIFWSQQYNLQVYLLKELKSKHPEIFI